MDEPKSSTDESASSTDESASSTDESTSRTIQKNEDATSSTFVLMVVPFFSLLWVKTPNDYTATKAGCTTKSQEGPRPLASYGEAGPRPEATRRQTEETTVLNEKYHLTTTKNDGSEHNRTAGVRWYWSGIDGQCQ